MIRQLALPALSLVVVMLVTNGIILIGSVAVLASQDAKLKPSVMSCSIEAQVEVSK